MSNYVKFSRFVFLADLYIFFTFKTSLQLILSHYCYHLFFVPYIIKQLLVSVFVRGIHNNQGYQPSASADNPYLDLDYSGYHENLIQ